MKFLMKNSWSSIQKPLSNAFDDDWQWNPDNRSDAVRILNNGRIVNFHIDWSSGTAAIRGNKPINIYRNCKYYWEVLLKDRIFGTSMMIGLTTSKAKLYSDSYINLIGENKFGWGLSHKGLVWHNNQWRQYTKPFQENCSTLIGCLYDGHNGTITYYKDGQCLGIAFGGLDSIDDYLYPTISSTAAQSQFILITAKREFLNLQDRCRHVLRQSYSFEHHYGWQQILPKRIFQYLILHEEESESIEFNNQQQQNQVKRKKNF
ncbi:SPRY domain-containing SOCS box protein SP555 [Dermatophagoides pteronyssinus]|uniref:SPRY domain-containing SOCS box protein SP555 n=1 Tax=Dermatophagoides pteronyssinus TaxID=6956 RepID=UPI003F67D0D0